jgi:hypothetical protein
MAGPAAITVNYRFIDGYHVYTSADVYGLYVANRDPQAAYEAVGPSLEKLIQLNEGIACRVRPMMTFSEMIRAVRHPNERIVRESAPRSFVAEAA